LYTFTGGTTATIQNSEIDNCTNGIEIYNASPSILNNNINEPQQNGIYVHGSGYTPLIFNNIVKKTSASGSYYHNYQGLYFTNSIVPYIVHNDVSGFCYHNIVKASV
jgi:hypothetical protein